MRSCSAPPKLLIYRRGWSATGGAERYLRRFADGLESENIGVVILADQTWPAEAWNGHPIERIDGAPDPSGCLDGIRSRHPGAVLFSMERIPGADVFRAGDGVHAAWLERLDREEGTVRGIFRRSRPLHRGILAREAAMFGGPGLKIVANSGMVADELVRYHHIRREQIAVIPNGYDAPDIPAGERAVRRSAKRAGLGIPEDDVVFLFVGSGWKRKGAQTAIDAFLSLAKPGCHLVIAGKGRARRTAQPGIHLTGPVPDPTDLYLAADVFVLPTLYDPFSNACLEAAAFGLPVLTTDANGFAEVLRDHDGSGEVIPVPRTTHAWAEAMERWTEPGIREAARAPLSRIRGHHTVSRNVTATIEFIRTAIPEPATP
ncbi:glycosyltransferase family 4 protein [Luteolibacter sp. SL250]|uniref:glycosyltransferase family 4 protein n=1 Tax=Luteolibacter sp. SL250 TaxID=2995170 RepID=UPI00226E999E|nr:glycosyltransferase family 4 protein [Luteolibacter sp. SL250]WAC19810.1 glycosyltransferase family 4 protein [Luteolibacter sp. SL250]